MSLYQALNEKADADKRHVILISSSRKNVPFYLRNEYEVLRHCGGEKSLLYRRYRQS